MDDKYTSTVPTNAQQTESVSSEPVNAESEVANEGLMTLQNPEECTPSACPEDVAAAAPSSLNGALEDEAKIYEKVENEEKVKKARRDVSRNGLNLSVFLLTTNVAAFAVALFISVVLALFSTIMQYTPGNGVEIAEQLDSLLSSPKFSAIITGLLNIICMYFIAFPIFCIMQIGFERRKYKRGGMGIGEFLILIPISQFVMYIGSYIGETINSLLSALLHINIQNSTIDSITEMPILLMGIMVCVFAPIVEEFMFRRALIGTLGKYGNVFAIIISAVAFGLFHGNLYQFFYAFLVGLILGYVYVKSGNWWLSVLLHAIMNFFGGLLPMIVEKCALRYEELISLFTAGEKVNIFEMAFHRAISTTYVALTLVLFVAGLVLTVMAIIKKWYKIDNNPEVELPEKSTGKVVFLNVGSIIFLIFSAITMALSIFIM